MDWDLWIGPAPFRPYHKTYHPLTWRPWWDFGSGAVGDVGCHTFHFYFKELRLEAPATIHGSSSSRQEGWFKQTSTPECYSVANMVTWDYPARGGLPPLRVHWYDGGLKPQRPAELDHRLALPAAGVLFVGDNGKLVTSYGGGYPFGPLGTKRTGGLLLPEEKFKDFAAPAPTLRRVEDHYAEWTQACKTGAKTVCPVEFGAEMTEMALLGALALRTGRVLEWDSAAMKVRNSDLADGLIDPPYRAGWSLE
jgi:predicted dehydrogenase